MERELLRFFCSNDSKTFTFLFDNRVCSWNLGFVCPKNTRTKSQSTRRTTALYNFFFYVTRKTSVQRNIQTLLGNFSHFKSHLSSRPNTPTQSCARGTAHPLQHFKGSKAIFKAKMQSRLLVYEALVKEEQSKRVIFIHVGNSPKD